jgi:hypothetical protein
VNKKNKFFDKKLEKSLYCDFFFAEKTDSKLQVMKFVKKTGAKSEFFWYISSNPDRFFLERVE